MSADRPTGWKCRFCSIKLRPQSLVGWRRLLWTVPVRPFRCPHCFRTFHKPPAFVAATPLVSRFFTENRGNSADVLNMIPGVARRQRNSYQNDMRAGWFVLFARWTSDIESRAFYFLCRNLRPLWLLCLSPFHWFSKRYLRSGYNWLPSLRSKSRSRSRRNDAKKTE